MILRMIITLIVIAAGFGTLLHLACYSDYFNKVRLKKIARYAWITAAALTAAVLVISVLVAINA